MGFCNPPWWHTDLKEVCLSLLLSFSDHTERRSRTRIRSFKICRSWKNFILAYQRHKDRKTFKQMKKETTFFFTTTSITKDTRMLVSWLVAWLFFSWLLAQTLHLHFLLPHCQHLRLQRRVHSPLDHSLVPFSLWELHLRWQFESRSTAHKSPPTRRLLSDPYHPSWHDRSRKTWQANREYSNKQIVASVIDPSCTFSSSSASSCARSDSSLWRMTQSSEWSTVGGNRVGNCNIPGIIFLVSLPPKALSCCCCLHFGSLHRLWERRRRRRRWSSRVGSQAQCAESERESGEGGGISPICKRAKGSEISKQAKGLLQDR